MLSCAPASGPQNSENPSGCSYLKNLNLLLRWPHEALLAFEQITFSPTVSFMFVSFFRLLSSLIDGGLLSPYFLYFQTMLAAKSISASITQLRTVRCQTNKTKHRIGLVTLTFRSLNLFRQPFVRRPRGFCHPAMNDGGVGYRIR